MLFFLILDQDANLTTVISKSENRTRQKQTDNKKIAIHAHKFSPKAYTRYSALQYRNSLEFKCQMCWIMQSQFENIILLIRGSEKRRSLGVLIRTGARICRMPFSL